jgi:hypothetical protein
MTKKTIAKTTLVLLIVGFVLWRNYGVIAKGDVLDLTNPTTNEQKELSEKVKGITPTEGQTLSTSFGVYEYKKGNWTKIKEVWDK